MKTEREDQTLRLSKSHNKKNSKLRPRCRSRTLCVNPEPEKRSENWNDIMKVTIDIECTPEEARTFFGLPDVKPMQEAMMAEMQKRMETGMSSLDMENLMKMWMPGTTPGGMPGLEQFQNMFWNAMNTANGTNGKSKKSPKK